MKKCIQNGMLVALVMLSAGNSVEASSYWEKTKALGTRAKEFMSQHKKKLVAVGVAAVVGGGIYLVNKLAEQRKNKIIAALNKHGLNKDNLGVAYEATIGIIDVFNPGNAKYSRKEQDEMLTRIIDNALESEAGESIISMVVTDLRKARADVLANNFDEILAASETFGKNK